VDRREVPSQGIFIDNYRTRAHGIVFSILFLSLSSQGTCRGVDQGLFESITGRFRDGSTVESVPAPGRRVRSVIDHLGRLFDTREGLIPHLRHYGLPDISEIQREMPEGLDRLREAIVQTVERYEPRLTQVRVTPGELPSDGGRLVFMLSGRLRATGEKIVLQTTLVTTGSSRIVPWKRAQA
jgi:type VI secretion system protein